MSHYYKQKRGGFKYICLFANTKLGIYFARLKKQFQFNNFNDVFTRRDIKRANAFIFGKQILAWLHDKRKTMWALKPPVENHCCKGCKVFKRKNVIKSYFFSQPNITRPSIHPSWTASYGVGSLHFVQMMSHAGFMQPGPSLCFEAVCR